jgi:hypothetical protein
VFSSVFCEVRSATDVLSEECLRLCFKMQLFVVHMRTGHVYVAVFRVAHEGVWGNGFIDPRIRNVDAS